MDAAKFVQTFLMMNGRSIYNRETKQYTLDKCMEEMKQRVGTYPPDLGVLPEH